MKNSRRGFFVTILIIVAALLLVGGGLYFVTTKKVIKPHTETETPLSVLADLDLFAKNDMGYVAPTKYVDDGVIQSGQYQDFHRVVALRVMGEIIDYIYYYYFITKDYKTFYYSPVGTPNTSVVFDTSKVVGTVSDIPLNHPKTIALGDFILERKNGFSSLSFEQHFDLSSSTELESKFPGLKFYWNKENYDGVAKSPIFEKYVDGWTNLKVKDSNGLVIDYVIKSQESYARSVHADNAVRFGNWFYFAKDDFVNPSQYFSSYDMPFPSGCGNFSSSGYIAKNISLADLKIAGITNRGLQLYTLVDSDNEINRDEHQKKILSVYDANYPGAMNEAIQMNNAPKPTYVDYVSKNPILFVKDPWGRFIILGEFQFLMPGGCGKPVVYLYPEKATEVKVVLEKPTRFTTDIPTYKNGWSVLAQPDGTLKDLQPQFTNCDKLKTNIFGSEYAALACKNNSYPYLYWSGQVDNVYPQAQAGWVVAQKDLGVFLDSKLFVIGLNEKERADMLSYWVPELQLKKSPYYRISLFQTRDMNKFAPMKITPTPQTLIRVFLDWEPLANNSLKIPEQKLVHIDRVGFTAVEWGGLKQ